MRRSHALIAVLLLGCASTPAARPDLSTTRFAPRLDVDLAASAATPGGAYVRDLRMGDGKEVVRGMMVAVRYHGWLADGTPFDSTGAKDPPVQFRVGHHDVIAGWEEGVIGMRPGGRRQFVIPPKLGYGARGSGPIPPDAVLVFVVELVGLR